MDKINRQFFRKSVAKMNDHPHLLSLQQPPEQSMPLEMKVFYVRDQLERISSEQVSSSPSLAERTNANAVLRIRSENG